MYIIGMNDMDHLGRATNLQLKEELKGTHTLTFQMPSKYFDSKVGDFVHNELSDALFNEKKLKLKFKGDWYEFYVKKVTESKQHKSIMYNFECTDAFIDELSRNGYGITFDTELYNNVEELGVFNEEILEDSIWQYDATKNIGDFTEYSEEKLFKIPIAFFGGSLQAYKLKYQIDTTDENGEYLYQLKNVYTGEKRLLEMGDDYARELEFFWDKGDYDKGFDLTETKVDVENDGYIYIPYSCLDFTYISTSDSDYGATEEAWSGSITVDKQTYTSYGLVPTTIDPSSLIQFIAIPKGAEVQIDEDGLLVNKDYTYVMTVDDWNENVQTSYWYNVEEKVITEGNRPSDVDKIFNLGVITYDGYLDSINDIEVTFGKKISITDRTEINISEDIDQYVTVYQNKASDFKDEFTTPDEWNTTLDYDNYRVCSYEDTRTIVPQLATNLVCNGSEMTDTDGWAVMQVPTTAYATSGEVEVNVVTTATTTGTDNLNDYTVDTTNGLKFIANAKAYEATTTIETTTTVDGTTTTETMTGKTLSYFYPTALGNDDLKEALQTTTTEKSEDGTSITTVTTIESFENTCSSDDNLNYHTFVNFGITGQEEDLVQGQTYLLYIDAETDDNVLNSYISSSDDTSSSTTSTSTVGSALKFCTLSIGSGDYTSSGNYQIDDDGKICFNFGSTEGTPDYIEDLYNSSGSKNIKLEFGKYYFVRLTKDITNPYFCITLYPYQDNNTQYNTLYVKKVIFSKAYTCGIDFFSEGSDVNEANGTDIEGYYKYTGRDIFFNKTWDSVEGKNGEQQQVYYRVAEDGSNTDDNGELIGREFLLETDVVAGDTYGYQRYFIQQLTDSDETNSELFGAKDTFKLKSYLNGDNEKNGLNPTEYTEEDYQVVTNYIDLYQCQFYNADARAKECDCCYNEEGNTEASCDKLCLYQKYGYCPYRFKTQKHCRRIRTLTGEKSNRFNLTQELSKVFEIYPVYYIEHEDTGKIVTDPIDEDDNLLTLKNDVYYKDGEEFTGTVYNRMRKKVFYMTEKGMENKLGFRYEKNLSNISRTLDSNSIVTKLYVEDVDSDLSDTGLCSIKTAEDNPSKDNYIIDFSYYTMKGMLDSDMVEKDLYGKKGTDDEIGYLKQLGYYNEEYDKLSNKIINLQDESYTELEANIEVNLTGIETAQKELNKIIKTMSSYSAKALNSSDDSDITESDTYQSYVVKKNEQTNTLIGLIESTFFTNGYAHEFIQDEDSEKISGISSAVGNSDIEVTYVIDGNDEQVKWTPSNFLMIIDKLAGGFKKFKEKYLDTFKYTDYGMMGQYVEEYQQIKDWKKERAKYLAAANKISLRFFQKYEPYLKEGTWSDSNYLSDNTYYFGAKEVAKEGAIPKVTYDITVSDIDILDRDGDYLFNIADTTYVEDIETFGINQKTGLPNRLKVIISSITYDLDSPSKNVIGIQNYTSQFEDLFEQISASVQSLSFNENTYKRSSNFTATKNVKGESLQGALDENQLTLVETDESNIEIDYTGQSGSDINNHTNQYKLDGQGLFFSNDGGQTWAVGVTPKGINADYINVGTLDATKIQIVDGNYLYFLWDNSGITAYRSPQATNSDTTEYLSDFARFNKQGLSLVENGQIRLRAGYDFNGTDGKMNTESEVGENKGIGFYLYDTSGNVIFKTEARSSSSSNSEDDTSDSNIGDMTARISLKGEIFVTDSYLDSTNNGSVNSINYTAVVTNGYKIIQQNVNNYSSNTMEDKIREVLDGNEYTQSDTSTGKTITYKADGDPTLNVITYALVNSQLYYKKLQKYSLKVLITTILDEEETTTYEYWTFITTNLTSNYTFTQEKTSSVKILTQKLQDSLSYTTTSTSAPDQVNVTYFNCSNIDNGILTQSSGTYYKTLESNSGYEYWELWELSDEEAEITRTSSTSEIGLFINNKLAAKGDEESESGEASRRLFSCIINTTNDEDTTNKKQNIFSIVKNGTLYIGGTVMGENKTDLSNTSMSEIPDKIEIEDPQIKMTSAGEVYMSFDKFKDMDTGESLSSTVSSAIASQKLIKHTHELDTLSFVAGEDEKNTYGDYYIGVRHGGIQWDDDTTANNSFLNSDNLEFLMKGIQLLNLNYASYNSADSTEKDITNTLLAQIKKVDGKYETRKDKWEEFIESLDIVYIPIANNVYYVEGETSSSGQASSSSSGISTAGYYLVDPLQV